MVVGPGCVLMEGQCGVDKGRWWCDTKTSLLMVDLNISIRN